MTSLRTAGSLYKQVGTLMPLQADSEKCGKQVVGQAFVETQTVSIDFGIGSVGMGGL